MAIDNRQRTKSKELEEIENDETIIDENDNPPRNYNAEDDELREKEENGELDIDENEDNLEDEENKEDIDEEALDEAEKEDEELEDTEDKKKTPPQEERQTDWKERHKESTREAQLLHERNKQLTDAFSKIDEVKEPTEEELQKAAQADGLIWDDLTQTEKLLLKKDYINTQKLSVVQGAVKDVKNIDEWAQKIDDFIDTNDTKQTHKALIGHEADFRAFALKPSHRGLPVDMLVSHFLMTAEPSAHRKGSMFLTNTGGDREKKSNGVIDAERAANLRRTNPKEYRRLLKSGKINIEI